MPRIFDNIEKHLLMALTETLQISQRADFCVGYFNLRGWKKIASYIDNWPGGDNRCCRLMVGMQTLPHEELRSAMSLTGINNEIDQQRVLRFKRKLAEEFRDQLTIGVPTNEDEVGLRKLSRQIKEKKVITKLFLRHPLHAKLYLIHRVDPNNPTVGFLGSSNLTLAGLSKQGELNVDVLDHDACQKLQKWFDNRWNDRWCIDISDELAEIIDESWAREKDILPYHIYLKMAYHLSREARAGLSEFRIPRDFGQKLLEFQVAAVKIAAHHLNSRSGVLIGDVVGLGKTLMATALARIFEDDHGLETLILCPKNLVKMWEEYRDNYRLRSKVLSISQAIKQLPDLRRYRLVIIDESQNLRNRDGKRYRAIHEYISENESKCILLSATPYNKTYLDLSNQLRLFISETQDIGIRPEKKLRELSETEFVRRHQCSPRSLAAFEKSEHTDDWRELMRLYLVRRTRGFIKDNYAKIDSETGRKYLTFEDGTRSYFPTRSPKTMKFQIDKSNSNDQYSRLYSDWVIDKINSLNLPRYGLGNYIAATPHEPPSQVEAKQLQDLSRAGKRLMGFCRTNLFKRLESSGLAFIQSVKRHIMRNYVYIHAIENELPLPIGTQDVEMLDVRFNDEDVDGDITFENDYEEYEEDKAIPEIEMHSRKDYRMQAAQAYLTYSTRFKSRFNWIRHDLFVSELVKDLTSDAKTLFEILDECGEWDPSKDIKAIELIKLIKDSYPNEKVLIFTQFADTVRYLEDQFQTHSIKKYSGVTGDSSDPTSIAWRFSPESNEKRNLIRSEDELRVVVATDVLSEGQNLQDCSIVVNYDLPWAIVRLVQRIGRVDRIGQKATEIKCFTFLPAEGVERIIRLRSRLRQRLRENAEVVGTDEAFFEDDDNDQVILDLYNEKAGIFDGEDEGEVDLASYAYQIWKNAIDKDPKLQKIISELPPVVYSTRQHQSSQQEPEGVLVYMKTTDGNDALAWVDENGNSITQSQLAILKAAECSPNTPPTKRHEKHHELVQKGVKHLIQEEKSVGGQLGRPSGARFRTYERLKQHAESIKGTIFESQELLKAIDDIYHYPLQQSATDSINRQLRSGVSNDDLAELVINLRDEDKLSLIHKEQRRQEPRIICSLGLFDTDKKE